MTTPPGEALAADPAPRAAAATVPARQEVTFTDGSALWLHRDPAASSLFERRLQTGDDQWASVDLRSLVPSLGFCLAGRSMRDDSSAVFHGLRRHYASADALREFIACGVAR